MTEIKKKTRKKTDRQIAQAFAIARDKSKIVYGRRWPSVEKKWQDAIRALMNRFELTAGDAVNILTDREDIRSDKNVINAVFGSLVTFKPDKKIRVDPMVAGPDHVKSDNI